MRRLISAAPVVKEHRRRQSPPPVKRQRQLLMFSREQQQQQRPTSGFLRRRLILLLRTLPSDRDGPRGQRRRWGRRCWRRAPRPPAVMTPRRAPSARFCSSCSVVLPRRGGARFGAALLLAANAPSRLRTTTHRR